MGRRTSSSGSLPTLCAADIHESFSEPFADGSGSLVIMDDESVEAARTIFQNDPWAQKDILVAADVKEWTIFLDAQSFILN